VKNYGDGEWKSVLTITTTIKIVERKRCPQQTYWDRAGPY
jgi:hypothetical protein